MGYTHYWDILSVEKYTEEYEQLINDTNLIIELADIPLEGWGEGATSIAKPDHGFGDDGNLVGEELGIGGNKSNVFEEVKGGDGKMDGGVNEKEDMAKGKEGYVEPVPGEELASESKKDTTPKTPSTATSNPKVSNIELKAHGTPYASLERGIFLNGLGSDGHETFVLPAPKNLEDEDYSWRLGGGPGGFCKTVRKPYDLVVCVVLMRAKMLMGEGFNFSSDGVFDFDKEWIAAREFYAQLWPEDCLTAEKIGMEALSEERIKEMESRYGPWADERWVGTMFMKEVLGPMQAVLNAMMSGEGVSEEHLEWLKGPLPDLTPNRAEKDDEGWDEGLKGQNENGGGGKEDKGPEGYVGWGPWAM
ncbi:hypothetical protein BDZ45DRAFT_795439 [Acephala macrosclerotiorum]|nr:hypothetical protein BDZ45DRAFT_795439 [Acephala macrosclerotiorum]